MLDFNGLFEKHKHKIFVPFSCHVSTELADAVKALKEMPAEFVEELAAAGIRDHERREETVYLTFKLPLDTILAVRELYPQKGHIPVQFYLDYLKEVNQNG